MKTIENNHHFETTDLRLATFLYASGVKLQGIDRRSDPRATFIFDEPNPELLSTFQSGIATINVFAYDNARNTLMAKLQGREP